MVFSNSIRFSFWYLLTLVVLTDAFFIFIFLTLCNNLYYILECGESKVVVRYDP